VTEADRASEALIVGRLTELFPGMPFGRRRRRARERVRLPLVRGSAGRHDKFRPLLPGMEVTLALEKDGELIAGVIFDPTRDELFTAEKGRAYLNGRRIRSLRPLRWNNRCSARISQPRRHLDVNIHFYHQLAMASHGVRRAGRRAGSGVCGMRRLDGFWEFGLSPGHGAAS